MDIWLIQTGEVLPLRPGSRRMRSGLLAEELGRRGHRVTWWVSAFDHFTKSWVLGPGRHRTALAGVEFEVLKGTGYRRNLSFARLRDHLAIARAFRDRAGGLPRPDLIIANLPEQNLAFEALGYARANGIPYVCDLRDLWPDFFVDAMPFAWLKPLARAALARDFKRARTVLRDADLLVTMMPSFLDWSVATAGRVRRPDDRVFYLGASRPADGTSGTPTPAVTSAVEAARGRMVVLFIGSFSRRSNPTYLLQAARRLRERDDVHFIIAGAGDYAEVTAAEAADLGNVTLVGWADEHDIRFLLEHADIGVVTANEPLNALPNKMFTYLSGGLPVLNAVGGDAAALVDTAGCGLNLRYDDVTGLADAITSLATGADRRREMAGRARILFERECAADRIYRDYADLVERTAATVGRAQSI